MWIVSVCVVVLRKRKKKSELKSMSVCFMKFLQGQGKFAFEIVCNGGWVGREVCLKEVRKPMNYYKNIL